jgi:acetyltransferase-like isoleucine patch superfamily enzyme
MNWRLLIKKLLGRPTCVCEEGVVFHSEARVSNSRGCSDAISVGRNSHIKGELLVFGHGGSITIGNYCFVGEQTRIWSAEKIIIGDRVLISHQVNIFDNLTHPANARARHEQFKEIITIGQPKEIDLGERPVTIENDVLIGCNSIVLRGVRIGTGALVGAGSVVTRDVPPWTVVAGNPAKFVREIPLDER